MIKPLALLACLMAVPAFADERPATIPTRDVDVTYEIFGSSGGAAQMLSERMRWDVAAGRMRVDPPTSGVYMLLDYRSHRLVAVREAERTFIEMDAGGATATPGVGRNATFRKLGAGTVAGVGCTEWDTRDSGGKPVLVCLTNDGVLLRARDVDRTLISAASVTYGPADPSAFAPPAGFRRERSGP